MMLSQPRFHRVLVSCLLFSLLPLASLAQNTPQLMPLKDVQPGMKGVAYTIYAGDQIEKIDLDVIGTLPNAMGPKTDVILVQLKGAKAEHSGVVAGMSGSPVYIDGELVGAISLKLGIFSKEPIAGVTPIAEMLEAGKSAAPSSGNAVTTEVVLPESLAQRTGAGAGALMVPIAAPLVFTGVYPEALEQYTNQFADLGFTASMAGGTAPAMPDDAKIEPGSMVGIELVGGDLSLSAGCTVTGILEGRVYVCGHPLLGWGSVRLPMERAHVLTTLNSELESTKLMTLGGVIGTFTEDRLTAVVGVLGAGPRTIPMELELETPALTNKFHFEVAENPKLTPLLVGLATLNGVVANTAYSSTTTLQFDGTIELAGHTPIHIENLFPPTDAPSPDGMAVAQMMQGTFARIFGNPYEQAHVEHITVHLKSIPEKRWAAIEGVWSDRNEVLPGETLGVKVLLRPYRGAAFIREIQVKVPEQAPRGPLRLEVSDSEVLNRLDQFSAAAGRAQLSGLEELIGLLNRERRNDRMYVTMMEPSTALRVEDKEMPDVPLSALNVLNDHRGAGNAFLQSESRIGEWSLNLEQVVSGQQSLTITVK
jgi:hypothetical protein